MSKQFLINGVKFNFSDESDVFFYYVKYFRVIALVSAHRLEVEYRKLKSFDKVYEQIDSIGSSLIRNAINRAIDISIDKGVYDMDEETFIALDYDNSCIQPWVECVDFIDELNSRLEASYLSEEERRRIRKESRGRIIGGGFGISGAAKGIITAGAINAATGIAHSIFNSIGNALDRSKLNDKKREIYNSSEFLEKITNSLRDCISYIGVVLAENILELNLDSNINVNGSKGIKKAEVLIKNIEANKIPKKDIPNIIVTILQNGTLLPSAYHLQFSKYFSEDDIKSILEMKRYLDIEYIESKIKAYCIINNLKYTDNINYAFEGDPSSQYELYKLLKDENEEEALTWLSKAVYNNNSLACLELAYLLTNKDNQKKFNQKLINKSKEENFLDYNADYSDTPYAYVMLGKIICLNSSSEKDINKAIRFLSKAIPDPEALYELSKIYRNNKLNFEKSIEYIINSANQGYDLAVQERDYFQSKGILNITNADGKSEYNLAKLIIENDNTLFNLVSLDKQKRIELAIDWYNKAYQHGCVDALGEIGSIELRHPELLVNENSVISGIRKLTQAADEGSIESLNIINNLKNIGIYGVVNNDAESEFTLFKLLEENDELKTIIVTTPEEWLMKSVSQGYPTALFAYAQKLFNSNKTEEAEKYLLDAALKNDEESSKYLIEYYKNSEQKDSVLNILVEAENPYILEYLGKCFDLSNDERAYEYLNKAAKAGLEYSKAYLAEQHFEGKSDNLTDEEAFKYLKDYVKRWDTRFIYTVGKCYAEGLGCDKHWGEAVQAFNRLVKDADSTLSMNSSNLIKNHIIDAYERLGYMLSQGDSTLEINLIAATEAYQKAEALGSIKAKSWLDNDANAQQGKQLLKKKQEDEAKAEKKRLDEIEKEKRKEKWSERMGCLIWIVILYIAFKHFF